MSIALATQLREGTKKSHTMAENTGFVTCFLKGVVDKSTYKNLLADLYLVYSVMEDEVGRLCKEGHPVIAPIGFNELNRRESLEKDLKFYCGNNWLDVIKATPSANAYADRIQNIARESPELLIGHHYTRYIGDLSGGQILKKIAQKAMNLSDNNGLNFYNFDDIENEMTFKKKYSQTLNSLPITQKMADSIVDEANFAFKCNMDMFQELEGNLIASIGKVLFGFLTRKNRPGSTE
ncbi:heme oxygenase (biliverdin-producing) [Prochlorococcus marinus]|uniref:Heme oxygenase n=1 Tax=Prochlorococcus marinus (strain MIT 9211) TaxID=93059 RepID=A9BCT4_PROM4|nr:heme oxygenase (biliverdin-producing) [Prochlorococcus marinus]ABX09646.1 Heme oxygenase [Prochlorococcus marinus str. MIT 9211]